MESGVASKLLAIRSDNKETPAEKNATKTVPLGGAFWDAGAEVFINKGVNGRWSDTLTPEEVAAYETRSRTELGDECAHWLATGEDRQG